MRDEGITRRPHNLKYQVLASNARFPDFGYCERPHNSDRRVLLPTPSLQHVGLIQSAYGQAFHRALQIFAHFK
jgi:hypothetical protein